MRTPRWPSRSTSRRFSPRSSSSSHGTAQRARSITTAFDAPRFAEPIRDEDSGSACPSLTVVIPTYNERANLRSIVCGVLEQLPEAHVVVVDDRSPDRTGDLADELALETGRVTVLHRAHKSGIGPAYIAGFRAALARETGLVATMDADGSHSPADLVQLVQASESADLVLGSRYVANGQTVGWPIGRRLLSRFGGLYARTVLGVTVNDLTAGFKVYRRETLASLPLDSISSDGYGFQIETTWHVLNRGLRVIEVPITFKDRVAGKSKLSRSIVLEAAIMVWRLRIRQV
jgi:dolichol-phosphate mannosyltransferase